MDFVSGQILQVDKPLHWTSFDVVKRVRGVLTRRHGVKRFKVGHAGTLDPLATGVMLICTGRATKRIDELQAGEKEYVATVKFGATTPSYDLETQIDATYPTDGLCGQAIIDVLPQFTGAIMQVPPIFSAVKIDGQRAYKMARRGATPEIQAKPIVISELELLNYDEATHEARLRVVCSKGTYIRSLARDLGEALKCGAHLTGLRRTRVGSTSIYDCIDVRQLIEELKTVELEFPEDFENNTQKNIKKQ